jgi:hypothetical protein
MRNNRSLLRLFRAEHHLACALIAAVLLVSCSLVTNNPQAVTVETQIAQGVAATLTAAAQPGLLAPVASPASPTPSSVPAGTLAPAAAAALPTAQVPRSEFFADAVYELADETVIGRYVLRVWHNAHNQFDHLGADQIATISTTGQPTQQIDFFWEVNPLSGTDITGDGVIEIILHTYSGGAHCCFGTQVYALGDTLERIMDTPWSNCSGRFDDLDGDGVLEFITCDDVFGYAFCPFAGTPMVTVVLAHDAVQGYVPASPRFPAIYAPDIERYLALAENASPGDLGEWDMTTKCAVLPLVLDYLYMGQTERAWAELRRLNTFPDVAEFQAKIIEIVSGSPLYLPPGGV